MTTLVERSLAQLKDAGRATTAATRNRLTGTLMAAATDPTLREALREARLTGEHVAVGFDVFGDARPALQVVKPTSASRSGSRQDSAAPLPLPVDRDAPRRRADAQIRLKTARADLAQAESRARELERTEAELSGRGAGTQKRALDFLRSRSGPHAAATMGTYTSDRGGIVFNGATTDWPCLVGRNAEVARITRNVLDRLRLRAVPILGPLPAHHGRMLAVAGEVARFHVDTAALPTPPSGRDHRYAWQVAADAPDPGRSDAGPGADFTFEARMPARPCPVTVTVTVTEGEWPVAFGTLTFVPLSQEAALKAEITALLREMVMPGEPSNPLVHPTAEAASRIWMLYSTGSVRLPWLEERATRLAEVVRRLRALGPGRQGEGGPDE